MCLNLWCVFMQKFLICVLLLCFIVLVSGCVKKEKTTVSSSKKMSSYNSERLQKLREQYDAYESENAIQKQGENKKYTIENDVLKIDIK